MPRRPQGKHHIGFAIRQESGVDYVQGWGKITGANQVSTALNEGGNQTIEAKNILITKKKNIKSMQRYAFLTPSLSVSTGGRRAMASASSLCFC